MSAVEHDGETAAWIATLARALGVEPSAEAVLTTVYPVLAGMNREDARRDVLGTAREPMTLRALWARWGAMGPVEPGDERFLDDAEVSRLLRTFATHEKLRIAARELFSSDDVNVTARELSLLAEVCTEIALRTALAWAEERFGVARAPVGEGGAARAFVVMGMGKLGGEELNAGSDIDLVYVYDADDGEVVAKDGTVRELTVHEYFSKVAERLTRVLDELTEHGQAWRVDLRLRPEGRTGPLVNSLPALESYYETWGRTWERAAWLRARSIAGDAALGHEIDRALAPFVYRRAVEPKIAVELASLVERARRERGSVASERDLKIGAGGIRDLEFFVQSLQLVWGGREPSLRVRPTHEALARLVQGGFVTADEAHRLSSAYLLLRRVEHRVQFTTMQQTHVLPTGELGTLVAKSLAYESLPVLEAALAAAQRWTAERWHTLLPSDVAARAPEDDLLDAVEAGEEAAVRACLDGGAFGDLGRYADLPAHLLRLGKRPDDPLGTASRELSPAFVSTFVRSLVEAADPDMAARKSRAFFSRPTTTQSYVRAFTGNPRGVRRLLALFGASSPLSDALLGHPELADAVIFPTAPPDESIASRAIEEESRQSGGEADDDAEAFVGVLRRAKERVTLAVGIADLGGEMGLSAIQRTLSALAEESIARCLAFATRTGPEVPMCVVALGKLGGRELGYGSDLDLMFVYEGDEDAGEHASRVATRVMRLLSAPHGDGSGYELDARLRPSGNQGLLVVSVDAFRRYHAQDAQAAGVGVRAQAWERQVLVKARDVAGHERVRRECMSIVIEAAYGRGAPDPGELRALRTRMEREIGQERLEASSRARRFHVKAGRGGLVDVEFAAQWLQMLHGGDARVRTPETRAAIDALEACGYVRPDDADRLRESYTFLRRVDLTMRMVHGARGEWVQEGAAGVEEIARRLGFYAHRGRSGAAAFLARYEEITTATRRMFERLVS